MAYGKADTKELNPVFESMQGIFKGGQKLYLNASGEKEILDGVKVLKENGVKDIVLVGGYEPTKLLIF